MVDFFKVIDNVWCIRRPSYLTCSYVVSTDEGYVFIDASMDSKGRDIAFALEKLKAPSSSVRGVILTHWHNDHSGGADYIQKICTRPVYCHENEGKMLIAGKKNSFASKLSRSIPELGPLVLLKGLLNEGPAIQLARFNPVVSGDIIFEQFEIIETPGHTGGHISIFDRKNKTLFAGDALATVNDQIRRMARIVTEDLNQAYLSMIKLLSYDFDVLCPGHRRPLLNCDNEVRRFKQQIELEKSWPLLG